jgi:hypothetical protein
MHDPSLGEGMRGVPHPLRRASASATLAGSA